MNRLELAEAFKNWLNEKKRLMIYIVRQALLMTSFVKFYHRRLTAIQYLKMMKSLSALMIMNIN